MAALNEASSRTSSTGPSKASYVIGCDIGGANLKLADTCGRNATTLFPMWLKSDQLAVCLDAMLSDFPVTDTSQFAITMTGELADCFATRRDGVARILAQLTQIFPPQRTWIYAVGNRWLSPAEAVAAPWDVAASNWHALATWIGQFPNLPVDLVLDIGSTTVDIIPMRRRDDGTYLPATPAITDRDRLELGQLVYTGLERTPVAAIVREVTVQGRPCPVMAESFATSDDCYILLGLSSESPQDCDTADKRPRTVLGALARLARMIGADSETLPLEAAREIAMQVVDAQAHQIARALSRNLPSDPATAHVTAAGHGRPLAQLALSKLAEPTPHVTWLADRLSAAASRCAPALAVASLLGGRGE